MVDFPSQNSALQCNGDVIAQVSELRSQCETLHDYFVRNAGCKTSIVDYFFGLSDKLLIQLDPKNHQISLHFAIRPWGRNFNPIRDLTAFPACWLIQRSGSTEFKFGFSQVCDLRAAARVIALEYRALGYSCWIGCNGETVELQRVEAEAQTSALWAPIQEVALCV
jgi:hypothetical protein